MLSNYMPSKYREVAEYRLVFDDGCNNGFSFPCDAYGNLLYSQKETPAAYKNLRYCLEHPEQFVRFNKITEWEEKSNMLRKSHLKLSRENASQGYIVIIS